jgi:hypothetical protein
MLTAMPTLHKGARALAWFSVANGVMSVTAPWLTALISGALPAIQGVLIDTVFGIAFIASGVFGLRRHQWAFWLPMTIFLLQIIEFGGDQLIYSLSGPLAFKTGWYWNEQSRFFAINFLAIAMVGLFGRAALQILEEDKAALRDSRPGDNTCEA